MKKIISLLVIVGSLSWVLTMFKSSLKYHFGLGFWGANGHDGVWHLSLANNLSEGNLQNPVFAHENIKNYHLGYDYLIAYLHNITGISVSTLYFQILPILTSLLIGFLTYKFVTIWTKDKNNAVFATIFVYFGGSAAWLLNRGESAFWSTQAVSTLVNPPFALSLVIILSGLILYIKKKESFKTLDYLFLGFVFSLLFLTKVYAGLLVLGSLFVVGLYSWFFKKNVNNLKLFISTLIFSLIFYIPFNKGASELIIWQPFWYLETLFAVGDRIPWPKMAEAMASYKSQDVFVKFMISYSMAFVAFAIGNFWTRLIFLKDIFKNLKNFKKIDETYLLLVVLTVGGIVIPNLFVQSGTAWNSIQFMYYSLFVSGILAGISISKTNKYFVVLILMLTVPTSLITLRDVYIPPRPPAMISNAEVDALGFLGTQPRGIVLTYPYELASKIGANFQAPVPLYKYASTSYVSAYSGHQQFFEKTNLDIMGYVWQERFNKVRGWYSEADEQKARQYLEDSGIDYIYWVKPQRALLEDKQLGLKQIFENEEVIIYSYGQSVGGNQYPE